MQSILSSSHKTRAVPLAISRYLQQLKFTFHPVKCCEQSLVEVFPSLHSREDFQSGLFPNCVANFTENRVCNEEFRKQLATVVGYLFLLRSQTNLASKKCFGISDLLIILLLLRFLHQPIFCNIRCILSAAAANFSFCFFC